MDNADLLGMGEREMKITLMDVAFTMKVENLIEH